MTQSIAERLHKKFKIVFEGGAEECLLQISGPIETQDQLDAVVEALDVMRDWLGDFAIATKAGTAATPKSDAVYEGAG